MVTIDSGMKRAFPQWQQNLSRGLMALSTIFYVFIYVNLPLTLIPGGMHDDGFFILRGMSMLAGEWMGPYNQYTLIKGAGYPLFLAAASSFHIPATLAHALLFAFSVWLLATLVRKVFHSIWISLVVFEVVLWNFGPETSRIVRDAIYHAQFVLCFSLLSLVFLATRPRSRLALSVLAGLAIGWMLITREEGLVSLPAFALIAMYFLLMAYREGKPVFRTKAVAAGLCLASAMLVPLLVSARNYRRYHEFETVDTQGPFAAAMSALESIDQTKERPFLAISHEVREKAYAVSPTFARLRPLIDDPGVPQLIVWKNVGCQFLPASCGDYGVGWFMWGMRDAVAMTGAFTDAHTSAVFFRSVRNEIEQACRSGRLTCHQSPLPLMPHMTAEELRAYPTSFSGLLRLLLFLSPPGLESGPSLGTLEQIQYASAFTNVTNFTPAPAIGPVVMNVRLIQYARDGKAFFIRVYALLLPVLLPVGFLSFLVCLGLAVYRRLCPLALVLVTAAWTAVILRLAVLALIDVTSFGAISNLYISLAFPASCFAAIAVFPLIPQLMAIKRAPRTALPLPRAFRGVGETQRQSVTGNVVER